MFFEVVLPHKKYQDPILNGAIITSASEIHMVARLLSLMAGYLKVQIWSGMIFILNFIKFRQLAQELMGEQKHYDITISLNL